MGKVGGKVVIFCKPFHTDHDLIHSIKIIIKITAVITKHIKINIFFCKNKRKEKIRKFFFGVKCWNASQTFMRSERCCLKVWKKVTKWAFFPWKKLADINRLHSGCSVCLYYWNEWGGTKRGFIFISMTSQNRTFSTLN